MKKLLLLASLTVSATAYAEDPPDPMNPQDLVSPTSVVEGAGVKVGEGTVIHPVAGLETGFVSNVFYEEAGQTNTAGLLRVIAELSTGSLPNERRNITNEAATDPEEQSREQGKIAYLASVYAQYDQYLSTNDAIQEAGGLGGGVLFKGIVNPEKTFQFGFLEHFDRVVRATNFESSENTNRDVNQLSLRLAYQPRGRNLGGYLYYRNLIDYFERERQQFANRFQNTFGLRVNYQWLPMTRVYADASIGYNTGLGGESKKIDSYPLDLELGIMTVLAVNMTLNAHAGYTNGFYASGPSYSAATAGVQFGYRYSPLGRAVLMYDYAHHDSINGNFFRDHLLRIGIDQQFVPFAVSANGELHFRRYEGITEVTGVMGNSAVRDDVIGQVTLGARYMFRSWFAAVVDYQFAVVSTDFRYDAGDGLMDDPSFLRHQLLAGVRAAY